MDRHAHETIMMVMHHLPLYRQVLSVDFRTLFRDYPDINQTHMQSLMFLMFNGDTTMTRLSRLLRLEKGSVTAVAARLLEWGMVSKETDPADRRRSILRLTDQGRHFADSVRIAHLAHFNDRIERLTIKEQQQFFNHLKQLETLLRKMADPDQLRCFFPDPDQAGCHGKPLNANAKHKEDVLGKIPGGFVHV